MDKGNIKDTLNFATINGFEATARDISYVILHNTYDNAEIAYYSIYGKEVAKDIEEIKAYNTSDLIECIRGYMISQKFIISKSERDELNKKLSISSEENKEGMIKLIGYIEEALDRKEISKKDGIAKLMDLRVKLQDKFDVERADNTQHIVVNNKFNSICPYCNHEISVSNE